MSGRQRDEWGDVSLDDEFVNAALVSEPSADERRRGGNRQRFEAASIAEEVGRKQSVNRAKRSRRKRKAKQVGVAGLILSGVIAFMMLTPEGSGGFDILSGQWTSQDLPSRSKESKREPLGKPAPIPAFDDLYVYVAMQPDGKKPVAYDPCRLIHYVTNTRTMPLNGAALVSKAIAEASRVTGLVFIDDGLTQENPSPERPGYDPESYGDRWSPVLISWTVPAEVPGLAGQTVGIGGSMWLQYSGRTGYEKPKRLYVSGTISLDGPQFAEAPPGTDAQQIAIIQHELGHLLGLNHVDDPTQLMYKETKDVDTYANGDLNGLAHLGAGDCFPYL